MSKETYYSVKRDLLQCQKRPTTVSKETYYSVKRDLEEVLEKKVRSADKKCAPVCARSVHGGEADRGQIAYVTQV